MELSIFEKSTHIKTIKLLTDKLSGIVLTSRGIIDYASPIPVFGRISLSKIATLGLNPSDKEFNDRNHNEILGHKRRFNTLNSLNISNWQNLDEKSIHMIAESCEEYFERNPYNSWFKPLDNLISDSGFSYYGKYSNACHLDLIPFATYKKWSSLEKASKDFLLRDLSPHLGEIIKNSNIQILILNGKSVIDNFQKTSDVSLSEHQEPSFDLHRNGCNNVLGYEYTGFFRTISGVDIGRKIYVYGFNHNLQSSFGVSKAVINNMKKRLKAYCESLR
ncbi:hypothetical protein [Tatumella sp. UBA2305]|uniref:hypothetical protein n=1 Tax=Tatumella sp. UBA2305 TaxID=1947647 RepID=UPI0025EEE57D|nr:hypothetical protein [Tatumella sp. UBA2305]